MDSERKIRLETKELEALMWCLGEIADRPDRVPEDPTDPLAVLLAAGWPRDDIMEAATRLLEDVYMFHLGEPFEDIEREILRVCIENGSWVHAYIKLGPAGGTAEDCRRALRELAKKLEENFGIECNFIARN